MAEVFNHEFIDRKLREFHGGVRTEPTALSATKYKLRTALFRLLECAIDCGCGGEHLPDCPVVEAKELLKQW